MTTISIRTEDQFAGAGLRFLCTPVLALALLSSIHPNLVLAQQSPILRESLDTIIDAEVEEEEIQAAADPQRVVAAIEKTAESAALVRKTSNLDKVEIIFLADSSQAQGGPPTEIAEKLKEYAAQIAELRNEIEGNALLFHAINSRQILMRDILAVEFDDANGVVIFAAAKPAG